MTALAELLRRVANLEGADREIDGEIARIEGWTFQKMKGDQKPYWRKPGVTAYYMRAELPNFTASADVAIALVGRVAPDISREIVREAFAEWIRNDGIFSDIPQDILIALLKALIAQRGEG